MSSLQEIESESLRRAMLKLLAAQPDHSSPDYILRQSVASLEGIRVTFDKFSAEQHWLKDQGLITVKGEAVDTLTLTQRGLDIAEYQTGFPGIAKKRPGQ